MWRPNAFGPPTVPRSVGENYRVLDSELINWAWEPCQGTTATLSIQFDVARVDRILHWNTLNANYRDPRQDPGLCSLNARPGPRPFRPVVTADVSTGSTPAEQRLVKATVLYSATGPGADRLALMWIGPYCHRTVADRPCTDAELLGAGVVDDKFAVLSGQTRETIFKPLPGDEWRLMMGELPPTREDNWTQDVLAEHGHCEEAVTVRFVDQADQTRGRSA